ncbi:cytochrome P450 [Deinococcus pimensis]|uniref:cytochrome P450 n=1 Tax=Deinococcus pimensis TaxID=309888 RepID=UPI00048512F8|nr:cytochrome P450 [Deinococcus pimensis]
MTTHPPGCPFHTSTLTRREAARPRQGTGRDERVVAVQDHAAARDVLRSDHARQAGFMSEQVAGLGVVRRLPVLFAEGDEHHAMRRDTARYFTPAQVATYRPMIARLADDLVAGLARRGEANLDDLSLALAVEVASRVVGLTDSLAPGLARRVEAFVGLGGDSEPGRAAAPSRRRALASQTRMLLFHLLDVRPAIRARRRERRDDLVSHLLDRDYGELDILMECVTYGTAGMATTREFVTVAAWHLLHDASLRAEYVHGTREERHAILHEILRLEPVVGKVYRRATSDLVVDGRPVPRGAVLAVDVAAANVDPDVVGEDAHRVCPGRSLPRGVQGQVLSFGDGHHRCPGAFLAIEESDVFLRRLLILRGLRIVREPTVTYNELIKGYEVRGFRVALGPR